MNPELPQDPNEQREAEVTALLLGELPQEKAAALLQAIERDPDLGRLHQRLKHAIELVRSISPGLDEQPGRESAPLRIGEQRRQRLLQQFKTLAPPEFARPSRPAREWLVPMAAALVVIVLGAGLLLPALSKAKAKGGVSTLSEINVKLTGLTQPAQLDGAKQQWALENKMPAVPAPASSPVEARKYAIVLPSSGTPGQATPPVPDLSHRFWSDANGTPTGSSGLVAFDSGTAPLIVTNGLAFSAGPDWIGTLDKSDGSQSANNAFHGRYAYVAPAPGTPVVGGGESATLSGWTSKIQQQNGNLGLTDGSAQQVSASKEINQLRVTPDSSGSSSILLPASPPVEAPRMIAASEPPQQNPRERAKVEYAMPLTRLPGSPTPEPGMLAGPVVANGGSVPNLGDVPAMGSLFRFKMDTANAPAINGGLVSVTRTNAESVPADNWDVAPATSARSARTQAAGANEIAFANKISNKSDALSESRADQLQAPAVSTASGTVQAQPAEKYSVNVVGYVNTVMRTNAVQTAPATGVNNDVNLATDEAARRQPGSIAAKQQLAFDDTARLENPVVTTESGREGTVTNASVLDEKEDLPVARPAAPAPEPQPEIQTTDNAFSTFSLNVSDVSFKLAAASLQQGVLPEPASIRSEEFLNAFDFRDPEPPAGVPVAFTFERARDPFAQNRDLLRFSLKTAASGRDPGRPLNIVLLLDNSGSMERADRVQIIHEALRVLAAQLHSQDTLSVVTFARTARLWVDGVSGSQAAQVADEVGGLTPQGGTNLEDAMNLAYQTALRHCLANGINRVVLLTDGAANLGNVDPEVLKQKVEANRKQGIALDCFGIGWEGYNDDLLETLTRNGDGRYGFLNTPEEAAEGFAGQLAGALHVAASDVKVQVEFNPARVTTYRQIGYAKHQLTKEQFRDNSVNAAQIGAAEAGNALYAIAVNPRGEGPLATVHVRYRIPGTSDYKEHEWTVVYTGSPVPLERSSAAMRLEATAGAFSEWLAASPFAADVTPDQLLGYLSGVPQVYGADTRPKTLEWMIRESKSLSGK